MKLLRSSGHLLLLVATLVVLSAIYADADLKDIFKPKNKKQKEQNEVVHDKEAIALAEELERSEREKKVAKTPEREEQPTRRRRSRIKTSADVANKVSNARPTNQDSEYEPESEPEIQKPEVQPEEEPKPERRRRHKPMPTINEARPKKQIAESEEEAQAQPSTKIDRMTLRPRLEFGERSGGYEKSKLLSASYLKSKMHGAYKTTVHSLKPIGEAVKELPTLMSQAGDSLSALLKLDDRGRLLAMIDEVNEDIAFVKREFSKFSIEWSPVMEKALNYLGDKQLDKLKWSNKDEFDFRRDALYSMAFGYEFMRLMITWRENLLAAHEAYKLYLESVKEGLSEGKKTGVVDENYMFDLKTIHTYLLMNAWLEIQHEILEPKMKLDFLMEYLDDVEKNYESEYFRSIILLQELYEPTVQEFDREQAQISDEFTTSGANPSSFEEIDVFYENFRSKINKDQVTDINCKVPDQLTQFMEKLRPQLHFNLLVYNKQFLRDLKEAKDREDEEYYGSEEE